jgi:hypothetical protein
MANLWDAAKGTVLVCDLPGRENFFFRVCFGDGQQ